VGSEHRSSNLQKMMDAFDQAAGGDPAPDMVVMPGGCDGGGVIGGRAVPIGCTYSYRSALAGKAREWGVYAAGGYHGGLGGVSSAVSVLFDANGDCLLEAPGLRRLAEESPAGTVIHELGQFRKTVFGVVGLYDSREPESLRGGEMDIVISCDSESADDSAESMAAEIAKNTEAICACCRPGDGAVADGSGRILASVDLQSSIAVFSI
jgi:hypothetical protein